TVSQRAPGGAAASREAAGAGDPGPRRHVEALLRAHEQSGGLLDTPLRDLTPPTEPAAASGGDGTPARPMPEGPGSRIGPYSLIRTVGVGGMGAVFLS